MDSKVSQQINNIVGENIKKLAQLFPSAVKDGEVDFGALKEELGQFEEVGSEKYELTWAGKKNARKIAQEDVIGRTLKYIPEDSKNADTTENLYIEGDNLEVLKLLRQNYYGAIKMIYIDPPYNTGNDFVYNDSFVMSQEEADKAEGKIDEAGEKFSVNSKSQNRYHANWLSMIYTRLKIAKDLLKDDGVIFISIDDKEVENLKKICHEIFGEDCFLGCIVRSTGQTTGQDSGGLGSSFDYILVYSKMVGCELSGLPLNEHDLQRFNNVDERGNYAYDQLRKTGSNDRREDRPNMYYAIENPDGEKVYPIGPTGYESCWRFEKKTYEKMLADNYILWKKTVKDGSEIWWPYVKYYAEGRTKRPSPLWNDIDGNKKATRDVRALFQGKKVFDYAKPRELINRIIQITPNLQENDIVLDFFAGSATTADALMNYVIDGVKIKYILVQFPEECKESTEAYKAGYCNICEIGKERIRRAGDKIKLEYPDANIDIGFKVFRTADTNIKWNSLMDMGQIDMKQLEYTPDLVDFMPDAKDVDVVYELMLRQRDVALSETLEQLSDIGNRTYLYASSYLVCLETKITEELVSKLAELDPLPIKFIFRDSAFKDDIALKDETFRRLKALIEKNAGTNKPTYTVEFI